jgi:hypothetical protein
MTYDHEGYFHEPWGPEYVHPAPVGCPNCPCCTTRLCEQAKKVTGFTTPELAGTTGIPCEYLVDARDREVVDLVRGCPCTAGMPRRPGESE